MWLIFDLDDTLIDTTGTVTPVRMRKALERVKNQQGFSQDLAKAEFQLLTIWKNAGSVEEAFRLFFSFYAISEKYLDLCLKTVYEEPISEDTPVKPLPGALKLLDELSHHKLFIVSKGFVEIQKQKIEKAGLELGRFCKILIDNSGRKKAFYQEILHAESALLQETLVIGDKMGRDLKPAKELGLWTVHMKYGYGANSKENYADFQIEKPLELLQVLRWIETKKAKV